MPATLFPSMAASRRLPNAWDVLAILCVFAALIAVGHVAEGDDGLDHRAGRG